MFLWYFLCNFAPISMVISQKVIKEKEKKQTGTKSPEGPAQENKIAPNHYIYRDKRVRLEREKKHTIMCNASYLYSYIEISRNSLISFFLPLLTTGITVKSKKETKTNNNKKRTVMLKSIQSIIPLW